MLPLFLINFFLAFAATFALFGQSTAGILSTVSVLAEPIESPIFTTTLSSLPTVTNIPTAIQAPNFNDMTLSSQRTAKTTGNDTTTPLGINTNWARFCDNDDARVTAASGWT